MLTTKKTVSHLKERGKYMNRKSAKRAVRTASSACTLLEPASSASSSRGMHFLTAGKETSIGTSTWRRRIPRFLARFRGPALIARFRLRQVIPLRMGACWSDARNKASAAKAAIAINDETIENIRKKEEHLQRQIDAEFANAKKFKAAGKEWEKLQCLGRSHTPTQRNTPSQRVRTAKENFALLWSRANCVVALLGGRANCVVALLESTAICVIALPGGRAKTGASSAIFAERNRGSRAKTQSDIASSENEAQEKFFFPHRAKRQN